MTHHASSPTHATSGVGESTLNPVLQRIEALGIVGAGGGGFPAAVKLGARVSLVIANAAECEPLLHKDKELLLHFSEIFLRGLHMVMDLVGAGEGVIGIKEKYHDIIATLERDAGARVRVLALPDVYPAGDEFVLVHMVTGRVIPPGGLPKDVDSVVCNVETLINIALDLPVTHKYLTIAGAVQRPVTVRAPIGLSIGDAMAAAGGPVVRNFGVLLGGVMMARPVADLDVPVTKTTGGIIVLPAEHPLIRRYNAPVEQIRRIGRAACDQCRFCTEYCPRFLLGHPIEPHRAMQSLGFGTPHDAAVSTLYCCECNLCTLYACPEDLDPKNVCVQAKPLARERGLVFKGSPASISPHPMAEFRRVPMRRLIARLGLGEYNQPAPLTRFEFSPRSVTIPLKQHAGIAAAPVVSQGQGVRAGDLLAAPREGKLGARVHASLDGRVRLEADAVVIEA